MSNSEDVIHFLEMEVKLCKERSNAKSGYFNGVYVGKKESKELNKAHVKYCQDIINRIKRERL